MHAVLRLIEHNARGTLENIFGHLHAIHAELIVYIHAHLCFGVVICRQAVHEFAGRISRTGHQGRIHLVGPQHFDALFPHLVRFTH